MKCKKCGNQLDDHAEFCDQCGAFTGYTPQTLLNGVPIDTKTYDDTQVSEDAFARASKKREALLNKAKRRPSPQENGAAKNAQSGSSADSASKSTASTATTSSGRGTSGTASTTSSGRGISATASRRPAADPGRITGGELNRRRGFNHTNMNGSGVGAQDFGHRILSAVAYLGWFGFIIAVLIGHKRNDFVRFHLNAALWVNLMFLAGEVFMRVGVLGSIVGVLLIIAAFAGFLIGIVSALRGQMKSLPLLVRIRLIK